MGGLLDGMVHGVCANNQVDLEHLPRMADFALWAAACETAFWPGGTFSRAYSANRRVAIETMIEADPLATCVRTIVTERRRWTGSASDLLRLCAQQVHADASTPTVDAALHDCCSNDGHRIAHKAGRSL